MDVYVRKIFPHDLTHEISLTGKIVSSFFDNLATMIFYRGEDESRQYSVSINNVTDPRFGGDFKQLCGELCVDDYIVIVKLEKGRFKLYAIRNGNDGFLLLEKFFHGEKDRHAIIRLSEEEAKDFSPKKKQFPVQVIYYGVPGTGKSFRVDAEINAAIKKYNDENPDSQVSYEKQVTRVVFHPEYGNADFIGQIMPKVREEGGVDYVFKAGPFSKILRKAYLNPAKPYFLIIEEINRGNAAAIFGDIFQSLDRLKNDETSDGEMIRNEVYKYKAGWSKYGITNDEINAYILRGAESIEKDSDVDYDSTSEDMPKAAIRIPARGMHFSVNSAIRLPPNLSLYATMNTSDQNVFTLDNAFQRRWEMKQVSNDLKNDEDHLDEKNQYDQEIGCTHVKWGDFRERINEIIMESAEENGLSSMEDKRLGGWFIIPKKLQDSDETVITDEAFAEKVLKYLWDDAFKFDRQKHFGDVKTLEELTKRFKAVGFKIFSDESLSILQKT